MAEKTSYPQIPSTVWWGVRNLLQQRPTSAVTERTLGVELQVQDAAARQYLSELKRAGILTEDNKATAIANKWRHDDEYATAVKELVAQIYPEELIHVAPPESADRAKVASWFAREGLGTGAAGNKAATYLLIGSATPNEPPARGGGSSQKATREVTQAKKSSAAATTRSTPPRAGNPKPVGQHDAIPLNVNVQIHISADASGEQIEAIFSAMRRYLYDGSTS